MAERSVDSDTLVFIPAWNEEGNLPAVLEELARELPDVDVLVVDDGSTDATAEVARRRNAQVLTFDENRGLPVVVASGYERALRDGYSYCGRIDADGQHPAHELRRLLERVRAGDCDVAVGSRFVSGEGYEPYRYRPSPARAFGTGLLRRTMALRLGRPFADATSGMYAAGPRALPILAEPYTSGAPEVESLLRLADAGLTVEEVPVGMRPRAGGESKLRGRTAVKLVLTVIGTLVAYRGLKRWRSGS
jgi:glycosyltransferase involved in cell wall biosynthesis